MYYVIYENSEERKVSSTLHSLEACEKWITNAKKVDLQYNKSYHYFIVKSI